MTVETRKQEILTGLTIIVLAVGVFLVGELAFRVLKSSEMGRVKVHQDKRDYIVDRVTGLRLFRPNQQLRNLRINNIGFRGPDLALEKPRDTFRLAFLGSSTTLDVRSSEDRNWPHLVVGKLRSAVKGCRVDYVNAGMPRYTLREMGALYEDRVEVTDPDLVIVLPGGVIASLDELAEQQGFEKFRGKSRAVWGRYSYLFDAVERSFRVISNHRSAYLRSEKLQLDPQLLAHAFARELQSLLEVLSDEQRLVGVVATSSKLSEAMSVNELASASVDVLYRRPFIYLPDLVDLRSAYNHMIPRAVGGHSAIALTGMGGVAHKSSYYRDRMHFTPEGSQVMSDRIFEELLGSDKVMSLLAQRGCSV